MWEECESEMKKRESARQHSRTEGRAKIRHCHALPPGDWRTVHGRTCPQLPWESRMAIAPAIQAVGDDNGAIAVWQSLRCVLVHPHSASQHVQANARTVAVQVLRRLASQAPRRRELLPVRGMTIPPPRIHSLINAIRSETSRA